MLSCSSSFSRVILRRGRTLAVVAASKITPNTSVNMLRHWKKAVTLAGIVYLATDFMYEYTFLGSIMRSVKESPTKWLNPTNISAAMDNAVFTSNHPYLADRPPNLRGRPTLCMNLNGCIVSTVYDTQSKRWQTFKRPGLELFLERLTEKYELVIWSSEGLDNAMDVVSRMDPERKNIHDTISKEVEKVGTEEKDLEFLGRTTKRVIVLDIRDNDQEKYRDNTIVIPPWYGSREEMEKDRTLYNILPMLDYIATQQRHYDLPKLIHAFKAYSEKVQKPLPFAFLEIMEKGSKTQPQKEWWKIWQR